MKKFRIIISAFTLIISLLASIHAHAMYAVSANVPGNNCQPANLQQALDLGLGWDQRGTRNSGV